MNELVLQARNSSENAYAPYSNFHVGAAVLLENGEVILGNNQENGSYPVGTCAERVAMNYARGKHPGKSIKAIAIHAFSKNFELDKPVSPCGMCRQAILEVETDQEKEISIILSGPTDEVYFSESIADLLPFAFVPSLLKK